MVEKSEVVKEVSGKYYIKNGYVFSSKRNKIKIFEQFEVPVFTKENENPFISNRIVIDKLDEILNKDFKEIFVSGRIEDFDKLKKIIEKKFNQKNKGGIFNEPLADDYDFIEKTSQIEIISQLIGDGVEKSLKELRERVEMYCDSIKPSELKKNEVVKAGIDIEEQTMSNTKDEKQRQLDMIKNTKTKISECFKKLEVHKRRIIDLEKTFDNLNASKKAKRAISVLEEKIRKNEFRIKDNEFKVNIIKAKISQVEDRMRQGRKKCIRGWLFLATLGLSYYTSASDCKHVKAVMHEKIGFIREDTEKTKRDIFILEEELEKKKRVDAQRIMNIAKKESMISDEIETEAQVVKKIEEEIKEMESVLLDTHSFISELDKKMHESTEKLIDLRSVVKDHEEHSSDRCFDILEKIEDRINASVERAESFKKEIMGQKVEVGGEWIVNL